MPTPTHSKIPSRLILNYPGGFAWPAADDRFGRYLLCDYGPDRALTLGVVDDFGNLVRVPSVGVVSPSPTTGMLACPTAKPSTTSVTPSPAPGGTPLGHRVVQWASLIVSIVLLALLYRGQI